MIGRTICSIYFLSVVFILKIKSTNSLEIASHRLPNNSYPLKYDLWLKVTVENETNFFRGNVKIKVKIIESSDKIILHSRNLKVTNLYLSTVTGQNIKSTFTYDRHRDFLVIKASAVLLTDSILTLDITFTGQMAELSPESLENKGIIFGRYTAFPSDTPQINYIFTEFEPFNARKCFPNYDEPGIKAKFIIRIEHEASYTAISNMPITSRMKSRRLNNYVITKFQETQEMSSYLLAFIISNFSSFSCNYSTIPQRIYSRPAITKNNSVKFIAGKVDKILKKFENFFRIRYPLPKLDHVIGPHYYTATENWGIFGYSESYFEKSIINTILVVMHEMAHNYFGNFVTPKWWSYLWLKEGLAKHYEVEIANQLFPNRKREIQYIMKERFKSAQLIDIKPEAKSLNHYVEKSKEILEKYDAISYHKGAAIIRMFQEAIGTNTWNKGVRYFLRKHLFSTVDPKSLHASIQKALDEDYPNNKINIDAAMKTWENQAGFPIVSVNFSNGTLRMSQRRKMLDGSSSHEIYSIPVFITFGSNKSLGKAQYWMTERIMELKNLTNENYFVNEQKIGYYDVEYVERESSKLPKSNYRRIN